MRDVLFLKHPDGGRYPVQTTRGGTPPPSPKPEGGYTAPPTPPLARDRVPPPLCYTYPSTASDGVTTQTPPPQPDPGGGVPPTQKYERGYPTPLSKKRGGVYPPPLQKVRGGPPPPLSRARQGTSPPPGAGTLPALRVESLRRGVFVSGRPEGGIPPLFRTSGGYPLPLSKK